MMAVNHILIIRLKAGQRGVSNGYFMVFKFLKTAASRPKAYPSPPMWESAPYFDFSGSRLHGIAFLSHSTASSRVSELHIGNNRSKSF